jgi:hypothetical protein
MPRQSQKQRISRRRRSQKNQNEVEGGNVEKNNNQNEGGDVKMNNNQNEGGNNGDVKMNNNQNEVHYNVGGEPIVDVLPAAPADDTTVRVGIPEKDTAGTSIVGTDAVGTPTVVAVNGANNGAAPSAGGKRNRKSNKSKKSKKSKKSRKGRK